MRDARSRASSSAPGSRPSSTRPTPGNTTGRGSPAWPRYVTRPGSTCRRAIGRCGRDPANSRGSSATLPGRMARQLGHEPRLTPQFGSSLACDFACVFASTAGTLLLEDVPDRLSPRELPGVVWDPRVSTLSRARLVLPRHLGPDPCQPRPDRRPRLSALAPAGAVASGRPAPLPGRCPGRLGGGRSPRHRHPADRSGEDPSGPGRHRAGKAARARPGSDQGHADPMAPGDGRVLSGRDRDRGRRVTNHRSRDRDHLRKRRPPDERLGKPIRSPDRGRGSPPRLESASRSAGAVDRGGAAGSLGHTARRGRSVSDPGAAGRAPSSTS